MTITRGHGKDIDAMIEQAYRRGYDQGFNNGTEIPLEQLDVALKKVRSWRHARKHRDAFIPPPGSCLGEDI